MKTIAFLFIDGFALMSTASALEPLRAANLFAGKTLFELHFLSTASDRAVSSLGALFPTTPIGASVPDFDVVFVVAGGEPMQFNDRATLEWLHEAANRGVLLGGLSGGSVILARAGLMANRRFTAHWHHFEEIERLGPGLLLERGLFVVDRDRYSCAGGTSAFDMMLALIARDHGAMFAAKIRDWFIQPEARHSESPQQASVQRQKGLFGEPVSSAIELMETHLVDQLSLDQLAALCGISSRQLQRQFHDVLGTSVMDTYRTIRLEKAHGFLRTTRLPIQDIANATGFANQAHFSTAFSKKYGVAPRQLRGLGLA